MAAHNELGKWGEQIAAQYLEEKGYSILARDWKDGHRDLDLVAMDGDTLVFVEVKTRSKNLIANKFVKLYQIDADIRFDIVAVVGDGGSHFEVNHITDAFLPMAIR